MVFAVWRVGWCLRLTCAELPPLTWRAPAWWYYRAGCELPMAVSYGGVGQGRGVGGTEGEGRGDLGWLDPLTLHSFLHSETHLQTAKQLAPGSQVVLRAVGESGSHPHVCVVYGSYGLLLH